jgi:arylsulfatase
LSERRKNMQSMMGISRCAGILLAGILACTTVQAQTDKPNILVVWGDDIGQSNISALPLLTPEAPVSR